ncbi:MAG: Hsp20/alpha crystallin family protein [Cyanobacteria bacterium P01_E01_bin.48]
MSIVRWRPFESLGRPFGWDPFHELEAMREDMNRLFERWTPESGGMGELGFMPSAELEEKDKSILLKLEVPGMDAKDIDIEITDDVVTVRGERKSESETEENGVKRSEFSYGKFERMIRLPSKVNGTDVEATYDSGIFTLSLPKMEDEKPKAVKVLVK